MSSRSSTVARPISSASSADALSEVVALVRIVAAAAAGLEARARSSPSADHQRTLVLCAPGSWVRTEALAYAKTSSKNNR